MEFRTLTFTATGGGGGGGDSFTTIQCDAGTSPVADSGTDTLTLTSTDLTITGNSGTDTVTFAIATNAVTNAKLAQIATARFKGRTTAGTGDVEDLTATQATALLNAFVGDSGSGGTKGLVPAPSTGDASKYLKGDGTWATVSAGIGGSTGSTDNAILRADGTGGSTAQSSVVTIADTTGAMSWTTAAAHRTIYIPSTTALTTNGHRYVEVVGTLTPGASASVLGAFYNLGTSGSASGATLIGERVNLTTGYTGNGLSACFQFNNTVGGSGTDVWNSQANYGAIGQSSGTTSTGYNVGLSAYVAGGKRGYGVLVGLDMTPSGGSGQNVGVFSSTHPGNGTTDTAAAVYGILSTGAAQSLPSSIIAAGAFNNGTTTHPALLALDNDTVMFGVYDNSNVVCGSQAAVATNATNGFLYIPTCAGTPTGVPTSFTGKVALIFDTTNNELYLYNGSWKKTTTFA